MLATDFANHADYFVRVQPELRYTHWSNETFMCSSAKSILAIGLQLILAQTASRYKLAHHDG